MWAVPVRAGMRLHTPQAMTATPAAVSAVWDLNHGCCTLRSAVDVLG